MLITSWMMQIGLVINMYAVELERDWQIVMCEEKNQHSLKEIIEKTKDLQRQLLIHKKLSSTRKMLLASSLNNFKTLVDTFDKELSVKLRNTRNQYSKDLLSQYQVNIEYHMNSEWKGLYEELQKIMEKP